MTTDLTPVAQLIRSGQLAPAMGRLDEILRDEPGNSNARHLLGICQRRSGQLEQAVATQQSLLDNDPQAAAVHQELGLALNQLRRFEEAIAALREATRLDPGLLSSWKTLGDLYMKTGQAEQALACYRRDPELGDEHPVFARAREFLAQNMPGFANFLFLKHSELEPGDGRGLLECARIAQGMGATTDAMRLLKQALQRSPDMHDARFDLVKALSNRQQYAEAIEQLQPLLEHDPDHQPYRMMQASLQDHAGRFEDAERTLQRVNQCNPGQSAVLLALGHVQRTLGNSEAAESSYYSALQADPTAAEPWFALANLKNYHFSESQVEAMQRSADSDDVPDKEQVYFHFALGRAFENRGEVETAFEHYQRGNDLQSRLTPFDAERHDRLLQETLAVFDELSDAPAATGEQPAPVFVLGLPRSGSTLVQQILAAHSLVEGLGELANVDSLIRSMNLERRRKQLSEYPVALRDLDLEVLAGFGQRYLDETAIRRGDTPWFVDKMPNNFEHIGFIARMLPRARFVDVRRQPMANGFSAYTQLFNTGQEWSYRLSDIAHYYRNYLSYMAYWDELLPGRVYHVQYERLVTKPEVTIREMLDDLGLPFEPACMSFHESGQPVKSASSEQVRQPMHRDAIDHWKRYEPLLQKLGTAYSQLGVSIDG